MVVAKAVRINAARNARRRSAAAVMKGSVVKRVIDGTAMMMPIHDGSMPIAFNHTGKNGRCVPTTPNTAP